MRSNRSSANQRDTSVDDTEPNSWEHDDGRDSYEQRRLDKRVRRRVLRDEIQSAPIRIALALVQTLLASLVILAIWSSWGLLYQLEIADPELLSNEFDRWTPAQKQQSLAAASEFLSTMIQSLIFHFPDSHLRALINELLLELAGMSPFLQRHLLVYFESLQLKPEPGEPDIRQRNFSKPVYQDLSPFLFLPKTVDISSGEFGLDVVGVVRHASARARVASFQIDLADLDAHLSLWCRFPSPSQTMDWFAMRIVRIARAVRRPTARVRVLLFALNRLFRHVDTTFRPIPTTAPETERFEHLEKVLDDQQLKRFAQGYEPVVSADKRSPKIRYRDTLTQLEADQSRARSDAVPGGYRRERGLRVAPALAQLPDADLTHQLILWNDLWKGTLFTFVLNKKLQALFRESVSEICTSWLQTLYIDLEIETFDFGLHEAGDAPFLMMSAKQPRHPFTYAIDCRWMLPKSSLSFRLRGKKQTSLLKIDISHLKLVFAATIHIPHPMLTNRSFLTFSFSREPAVDFDMSVDTSESHIFHIPLSVADWFVRFTSNYALKPFFVRWLQQLLQLITAPGKLHIPWFDRPTEFVFSRLEAESWFSSLRSKLSTLW